MPELQKRRQLVNSKIEMLNREQQLLRTIVAEEKKEFDIKAGQEEFAALVSNNLKRISFENKQKLLRIVLEKVVVKDWRVDVHYNIPLPKPPPPPCQPNSICVPHVEPYVNAGQGQSEFMGKFLSAAMSCFSLWVQARGHL